MKKIYIVLIKAHTGLGSIARKITGYEYTHIAVCTDRRLTDFMSFSRRRHYLPFDAGFMHEKRDHYAFGSHKSFKAKVFELEMPDENFEAVKEFIGYCENDDELIFNLFSMATMPIFHGINIHKAYNCMSFTAKILEISGIPLDRPFYRYSIEDMDKLLDDRKIFEGRIMRETSENYEKYMEKPSATEYLMYGGRLLVKLTSRLVNGGIK